MQAIEDLKLDVAELQKLEGQATRSKVKDVLMLEIRKLQTDIVRKTGKLEQEKSAESGAGESVPKPKPVTKTYTKEITNYGWDQSEKFMKIYVTLNGVQHLDKENVTSQFTDRSFKMRVQGLDGKDHQLHVVDLMEEILTEGSYHKVKTDMVLVMLKKKETKTWPYVTVKDKKVKEAKTKPKEDDKSKSDDPGAGLMDMMKKMYDDGDDEMKRTIAKAWHDSQMKQQKGGPADML